MTQDHWTYWHNDTSFVVELGDENFHVSTYDEAVSLCDKLNLAKWTKEDRDKLEQALEEIVSVVKGINEPLARAAFNRAIVALHGGRIL